jgi:hypothetical protein
MAEGPFDSIHVGACYHSYPEEASLSVIRFKELKHLVDKPTEVARANVYSIVIASNGR